MRDRLKLEALLANRFPGSTPQQIAAAANAIMGLEDEWEHVQWEDIPADSEILRSAAALSGLTDVRLLRRRAH